MEHKVHFFKSEEGKMFTVRKGIFNDPMQDGLTFRFVKGRPDIPLDDPVLNNLLNKEGTVGNSNLAFGWANITVDEQGELPEDFDGDMIPTGVLEAASYSFALSKGFCNQEHRWGTECGYLIECMMFTKEKMQAMGIPDGTIPEGMWVGFYIPDDDVYAKVKSGEYRMFSIEGYGRRVCIDGECNSEIE